ncbi:MAG: hypothetical protein JWR34_5784 [Mycobacterium sp.]|nr:hypothetical protein [Mycobacterium sp.]
MLAEFRDRDKVSKTRLCAAVDSGSVQPTQFPRQIAASRYVGCMAAVTTSPIVAVTMTHESKP